VIFGDGKQVRDFIHVEDVVRMHNECIKNEKAVGVYNVGTGKGVTINELAQKVIDVLGSKLEVIHEEVKEGEFSRLVEGRRRIPMELKQMVLDIRKAKRELGFSPKISLKEGIRREMDWASNNPNAWNIQGIIRI
jgi:UDP-glucose 4-epimerase